MEFETVSGHSKFLSMFRFDQLAKGSILALEKTSCNRSFIVVKGEVGCYKKLY